MTDPYMRLLKNNQVTLAAQLVRERAIKGPSEEGWDDLDERIDSLILTVIKETQGLCQRLAMVAHGDGEGFYLDEDGVPQDANLFDEGGPSNPEGYNRVGWQVGLEMGLPPEGLEQIYGPRPDGV